jgi:hypothetical protein
MVAAVKTLTRSSPMPKFAPEYLEAIRRILQEQDLEIRAQRESRRLSDLDKPTRCPTCRDSGWVCGLPHLESVHGVEWLEPRYTQAVLCVCGLGHHLSTRWASAEPPRHVMGLREYETRNPYWRAQQEARRLERAAESAAHSHQHGDPAFLQAAKAVLARLQEKQPAGAVDL